MAALLLAWSSRGAGAAPDAPSASEVALPGPQALPGQRRRLRVTWSGGGSARVEALLADRWRPAARPGLSPITTRPLPVGTAVRVVRDDVPSAQRVVSGIQTPADVAAWSGPGLRGARVVDLDVEEGRLWAATLDGGLAAWDGQAWRAWTRRDGLPGDRVVEVDAVPEATWAATDGGLVRVESEGVARVWTTADGLPDDYTQAVLADGEVVWAGTYRGLARVTPDDVRTVLSPGSCFSLLRGPDQRPWAGYRGLRGLPDGEPIEGVDPSWRIFAVEPLDKGVWLASDEEGVLWLDDGLAFTEWRPPHGGVFALADTPRGLVAAAGEDGVWQRTDEGWIHHDLATGLPSPVANTVRPGPRGKVWVGTDRGAALLDLDGRATALPLAPLPAGVPVLDAAPVRGGVAVAGEEGLVWIGRRPPRGWSALRAAVADVPVALRRIRGDWWVLEGDSALRLDRRGRLERWRLPGWPMAITSTADGVVIATEEGLYTWLPGATQLGLVGPQQGVRTVHVGWDGGLWVVGDAVSRLGAPDDRTWHQIPGPRDVTTTPTGAWIASEGGLYRIDASGQVAAVSDTWSAGPLVAVSSWDAAVWVAGEDGRVWGPDPARPRVVDLGEWLEGARVERLVAAPEGVWAATDRGLFHIDARVQR